MRVRSVCNSDRHASDLRLPNTARNEEIDCVATIGMQRHCPGQSKGFFIASMGRSSPTSEAKA